MYISRDQVYLVSSGTYQGPDFWSTWNLNTTYATFGSSIFFDSVYTKTPFLYGV
jgi:hypothetical protein